MDVSDITVELFNDGSILYRHPERPFSVQVMKTGGGSRVAVVAYIGEKEVFRNVGDLNRDNFRARAGDAIDGGLDGDGLGQQEEAQDFVNTIAARVAGDLQRRKEAARGDHANRAGDDFRGGDYAVTPEGGFAVVRYTDAGEHLQTVTNFTARVVRDIVEDDGAESVRRFELEVNLHGKLYTFAVPAAAFAGMAWIFEHVGTEATVMPGLSSKDHARVATQLYGPPPAKDHRFGHTGWRKIDDGRTVFLHAGGAIGQFSDADWSVFEANWSGEKTETDHTFPDTYAEKPQVGQFGQLFSIGVSLQGNASFRALPKVPERERLKEAVRASMSMASTLGAKAAAHVVHAAAYRAPLPSDFEGGIHIQGQTGEGKTELAALGQQHFGAEMGTKRLLSWESTANYLEDQAFRIRNQLLVVDDFIPRGTQSARQILDNKADRLFRGAGNHAGRGRMRADLTIRPERPPHALVLSTGEDIPTGHSLRARILICEVAKGELDFGALTDCQKDAAGGVYAEAMAGYVAWLAENFEAVSAGVRTERDAIRDAIRKEIQHKRTPTLIADLVLGARYFARYAEAVGAVSPEKAEEFFSDAKRTLVGLADLQAAHQAASDPVVMYLEYLAAAISSGRAHVAGVSGDRLLPAKDPEGWGWRYEDTGGDDGGVWRPQGDRIGRIDGDDLYLIPDAALKVAQDMSRSGAEQLNLTKNTISKALYERGYLVGTEANKRGTYTVRKMFEGRRSKYLHLNSFGLSLEKVDQTDQLEAASDNYGESAGQFAKKSPTKSGKNLTNPTKKTDQSAFSAAKGDPSFDDLCSHGTPAGYRCAECDLDELIGGGDPAADGPNPDKPGARTQKRRTTPDEAMRIQRLVSQGMDPKKARREVLGVDA